MQKVYGKIKKTRIGNWLQGDVTPIDYEKLPRKIFVFWNTGLDTAPENCRFCVKSWQVLNPDWELVVLDQSAANAILPRSEFPSDMAIAHYADLLRTKLMLTEGGVWADATCLCTRPLDDWLPMIFAQTGFFALHRPGRDRVISNWFLASKQEADIPRIWLDNSLAFWRGRKKPPRAYFWHHYMFEYSWLTSGRFRKAWKTAPKLSAVPFHRLQRTLLSGELSQNDRDLIQAIPLHKLCYKRGFKVDDIRTSIREIWGDEAAMLQEAAWSSSRNASAAAF
ncbi:capsular polysaccharide synthesis protein [Roseibium sediminicola]|uniref:Capsular polysaccharide synthesis protein n=1 Tax=Roseibium sediminicola TaxID=2933272 RepID=A0ABT0GX11_9HYPH|nr:capsular polysaccharide synthesis protein [Roseibium sp. CAU 1639]MCK7613979.1 capsular polysaccharide synthesis protein [Roseibium sp. CAU 1639]